MPARTLEASRGKLDSLPAAQLIDVLAALASGDLEAAKKAGGVPRGELITLQPDGESGNLLDGWERKAVFSWVRKTRLAVLAALPEAVLTLAAIAEGPACEGDVEAGMDASDVPLVDPQLPTHEQEQAQRKVMSAIAKSRVPNAKNLSEKRNAALALFDLAQKLDVFSLAKEFREADAQADEEEILRRMVEEQGLGDLYNLGEPEQPLRRVK